MHTRGFTYLYMDGVVKVSYSGKSSPTNYVRHLLYFSYVHSWLIYVVVLPTFWKYIQLCIMNVSDVSFAERRRSHKDIFIRNICQISSFYVCVYLLSRLFYLIKNWNSNSYRWLDRCLSEVLILLVVKIQLIKTAFYIT